mgnify:CR=1 FL=1
MATAPELSIVIPFRNEALSLPTLYGELREMLGKLGMSAELIFVDDASTDESQLSLLGVAQHDERMRLLSLATHCGQSAALDAGFRAARGEWIATLDADLQNDPADLPRLILARDGVDCVNGVRVTRRDSVTKRWASRIANGVRRWVLADPVSDIGCSLRLMRARTLRPIRLFRGAHRFLPVLLQMEGARLSEVPVGHRPRRYGRSKYSIGNRLVEVLIDLMAVSWMAHRRLRYEAKEIERVS